MVSFVVTAGPAACKAAFAMNFARVSNRNIEDGFYQCTDKSKHRSQIRNPKKKHQSEQNEISTDIYQSAGKKQKEPEPRSVGNGTYQPYQSDAPCFEVA